MIVQGVDINKFDEKQLMAIEILAQPKRKGMTYEEIAEHVGVDVRTLFRWRQKPEFVEAITKRAMLNLHTDLPEVFDANLRRAKVGEVRSVELIYKLLGLLVHKTEDVTPNKGDDNESIREEINSLKKILDFEE